MSLLERLTYFLAFFFFLEGMREKGILHDFRDRNVVSWFIGFKVEIAVFAPILGCTNLS